MPDDVVFRFGFTRRGHGVTGDRPAR
jgi:hypothetical protein